eukprot:jgi/Bigna1/87996/estExt_fgenesh1_pg.C_270012
MDPKAKELFKKASQKNNVSSVKKFLEQNSYLVDQRDVEYRTILHRACQNHDLDLISYLVQNHQKIIDAKDTGGWTCFHFFIDGFKSNAQKIPREVYEFVQTQCTAEVKHGGRGAAAAVLQNKSGIFAGQVQAADKQGMTALMHMCRIFKKAEGEKKIFEHNVLGETAIAIAQRRGEAALLALMKFVIKYGLDSDLAEIQRSSVPRARQELQTTITTISRERLFCELFNAAVDSDDFQIKRAFSRSFPRFFWFFIGEEGGGTSGEKRPVRMLDLLTHGSSTNINTVKGDCC